MTGFEEKCHVSEQHFNAQDVLVIFSVFVSSS